MRKRIINRPNTAPEPGTEENWLEADDIAEVEVSSEDPDFPIESAVVPGKEGSGWRSAEKGEQLIRLRFDPPRPLQRIRLSFLESVVERTQEFVLRWSDDRGPMREIVRQQWNFSPQGSTSEVENYRVNLANVAVLELAIRPELTSGNAFASLTSIRLA